MRFVLLIAIAVSLLSGPFAPMALCSMPAPCHGEHSCCLVASPDMQAVLPAHTASFDMAWMPLAMMSPASAYEFVDDRLLRVPPILRAFRSCVCCGAEFNSSLNRSFALNFLHIDIHKEI